MTWARREGRIKRPMRKGQCGARERLKGLGREVGSDDEERRTMWKDRERIKGLGREIGSDD